MSVLDGSMIQLQFRWRGSSGKCVFLTYTAQILFDRFFADGHLPCHGFQWQTGRVELQCTPFLMTESWAVGGVIGREDVGEARRNPVSACGNFSNRETYLVGVLAFQRVSAGACPHRRADGRRPVGRREDKHLRTGRPDGGHVAFRGTPVAQFKVEQHDVRAPAGPGEQRAHSRRGGDHPDVARLCRDPARDAVEDDRMIVHGRDVNDTRQAAPSFRQLTSRKPPPVSVTFNATCQPAAAGTSFPTPVRSGVARSGALKIR